MPWKREIIRKAFQSTPSVWRETRTCMRRSWAQKNFNPLPPCGGRPRPPLERSTYGLFQSTPSVWRETLRGYSDRVIAGHISIHSLRVEGDHCRPAHQTHQGISIHSLRVEGDMMRSHCSSASLNFNPLPPCGGRRHPAKHAADPGNFNPLPPCGGRRVLCK